MTALVANRDALAEALHKAGGWKTPLGSYMPEYRADTERIAAALIASGAVIDASTLAEDQPLVYRVARWLYAAYDEDPDKGWPDESEHARTTWSNDARDALRALAAALAERSAS